MNQIRIGTTTVIACLALFAVACESTPHPRPSEKLRTADDYHASKVREITVMPVRAVDEAGAAEEDESRFPSAEMRRMLRHYLIKKKSYATPTAAWVDNTVDALGGVAQLDTDAVLEVEVQRWDTEAMGRRGVIYASATFDLTRPDGTELWSYRCDDVQLTVKGPYGDRASLESMRAAARRLTERALAQLPRKL